LLMLSGELLLGQFAAQLVRMDLDRRIDGVRAAAQTLASAASHGAKPDVLEDVRLRVPRLAAIVRSDHDAFRLPPDSPLKASPAWIAPDFSDLFQAGERFYIGAIAGDGRAEAFAYVPFDEDTLASLTPGVVSVAFVSSEGRTTFRFGPSGSTIDVAPDDLPQRGAPPRLASPQRCAGA